MRNDDDTYTIQYKGEWLTYTYFYEVCDFVQEVDELDAIEDEVEIARIAQRLDSKALSG